MSDVQGANSGHGYVSMVLVAYAPTVQPSAPSVLPTLVPSAPTFEPTITPTCIPTRNPSFLPSTKPTFNPSFAPSYVPSFSPTYSPTIDLASATVTHDFNNITTAGLNTTNGTKAIKEAISISLNREVQPDHIQILSMTQGSGPKSLRTWKIEDNKPFVVTIVYKIFIDIVPNQNITSVYIKLKNQLRNAISSGNLTKTLKTIAKSLNIPGLFNVDANTAAQISELKITTSAVDIQYPAVSNSPTYRPTESSNSQQQDKNGISTAVYIGIAVGIFVLLVIIIGGFCYYLKVKRKTYSVVHSLSSSKISDFTSHA